MSSPQRLPESELGDGIIHLPVHGGTVTAEDVKVRLVLAADFGASMIIDASAVETVGQAVVQLLIAARAEADATGQSFAIVNPSEAFTARIAALGLTDALVPANAEEFQS